jgi:hypothetical protein
MKERRLDKWKLCVLQIDATPFAGQQMVVALGISQEGRKTILGIRHRATENATVVGELWGDLVNRGLDFSPPRLYVLDGGKALHSAVKKYAGESAPIQRCQVHKRRNVLDHLTDEPKPSVAKKAERGVRTGGLRRRQQGAGTTASRTDGSESQGCRELGGRNGGNTDRAPAPRSTPIAENAGQHKR